MLIFLKLYSPYKDFIPGKGVTDNVINWKHEPDNVYEVRLTCRSSLRYDEKFKSERSVDEITEPQ